mgnify:CR=1 FL=1
MGELMKEDGEHELQKGPVRHPGVVVLGDRAFVFICQPLSAKGIRKNRRNVRTNMLAMYTSPNCFIKKAN